VISIVTNSAAGKAIHTPFNPNIADSINAKKMIATKPREIDAANTDRGVNSRYPIGVYGIQ
jgi:hypothetical protein